MKFTARLEKFNSNLWGYHIMIPPQVADHFISGSSRRVICIVNEEVEFQSALMPAGDGLYFINLNKERRKKLGVQKGDELRIELLEDDSKYGLPVPEELSELLRLDPEGKACFEKLTPGKQRTLIYMIGKPKTFQTRINKAVIILDYLKDTNGRLDFLALHEALKNER